MYMYVYIWNLKNVVWQYYNSLQPRFWLFYSPYTFVCTYKKCNSQKENPLDFWEKFFKDKFSTSSKILFVAMSIYVSFTMCIIQQRAMPYPELPEWVSVLYIVKGINIHQYIHIYIVYPLKEISIPWVLLREWYRKKDKKTDAGSFCLA